MTNLTTIPWLREKSIQCEFLHAQILVEIIQNIAQTVDSTTTVTKALDCAATLSLQVIISSMCTGWAKMYSPSYRCAVWDNRLYKNTTWFGNALQLAPDFLNDGLDGDWYPW